MEALRKHIDGSVLNRVIPLPVSLRDARLEVIILKTADNTGKPRLSRADIDATLHGSLAESLYGSLSGSSVTLDECRRERLSKYERTD